MWGSFEETKIEIVLGDNSLNKNEWVRCPICQNKTRLQIREDTELKNFPLYCPKCKQESLIDVKNLKIAVITEPDVLTLILPA